MIGAEDNGMRATCISALTMWLLDEGCDNVGQGGHEAHHDAPVEGDGHDAVHYEDDEDEIPAQQERVLNQVISLHKRNVITYF